MTEASPSFRVRQLRWQCRRGTQELDHLLGNFMKKKQAALEEGEYPIFEILLKTEDDVLWDWMLLRTEPDDPALQKLIAAIRTANGL